MGKGFSLNLHCNVNVCMCTLNGHLGILETVPVLAACFPEAPSHGKTACKNFRVFLDALGIFVRNKIQLIKSHTLLCCIKSDMLPPALDKATRVGLPDKSRAQRVITDLEY